MSKERRVRGLIPVPRTKRHEKKDVIKVPPRELKIAWASDDSQWKMIQDPSGSGNEVAKAIRVMWLEVKASYRDATPGRRYQVGFKMSLDGGGGDVFGWDNCAVFLMVKLASGGSSSSYKWKKLYLNGEGQGISEEQCSLEVDIPSVVESEKDRSIEFGIYEVWGGRWKGGLIIHHAFVKQLPVPTQRNATTPN